MKIHEYDDLVPIEDTKLNCYTFHWSLSIITELYDNGAVKSETTTAVASYVFDVIKKITGLKILMLSNLLRLRNPFSVNLRQKYPRFFNN